MLLPFVIFAVGLAGLVLWALLKDRASSASLARELSELGFRPCGPESRALAERVTRLENNSEYRYKVQAPLCLSLGEKAVYHYTKERRRQGNIVALAPAGASLYELIHPKTLVQLEPVADFGVLAVSCRGDDCALTSAGFRSPLDLARLWPVVRQLAG